LALTVRVIQPYIDQIQLEHIEEHVEQGMKNMRWFGAAPHDRESEDADQVINAALKALDLCCELFRLRVHFSCLRR